jgi:Fibronectin type III domain
MYVPTYTPLELFHIDIDCVLALPGPPSNVRASEITATSVRLTWSFNGPEDPQYYVIQFKPKYANQVSHPAIAWIVVHKIIDMFEFLYNERNYVGLQ